MAEPPTQAQKVNSDSLSGVLNIGNDKFHNSFSKESLLKGYRSFIKQRYRGCRGRQIQRHRYDHGKYVKRRSHHVA